jgi:hypothetical protein
MNDGMVGVSAPRGVAELGVVLEQVDGLSPRGVNSNAPPPGKRYLAFSLPTSTASPPRRRATFERSRRIDQ